MSALRNPTALAEEYLRLRASLLAEFPDLESDAHALADTLDGMSDATEVVATLIRGSRQDAAFAKAIGVLMDEMAERKERFAARAERRREMARLFLERLDRRKVEFPDFTAIVAAGRPRVIVAEPEAVPDALCRIKREPDKAAIREAIEEGKQVPGAFLSNGGDVLSVRFK